jgi:hypothetical protein
MRPFATEQAYENHKPKCAGLAEISVEMPSDGAVVKFTKFENKFKGPGIIYYDFEASNKLRGQYKQDNRDQNRGADLLRQV